MKYVTAHHGLTSLRGFSLCLVSSPRLCVMSFVFFSFYFLLYFKDLFDRTAVKRGERAGKDTQ